MPYEVGERNLAMLQYKFIVEWADGSEVRVLFVLSSFILFQFILFAYRHSKCSHRRSRRTVGDPVGHSAIARTVGINLICDVAAQLGVRVPYMKEIPFGSCWRRRGLWRGCCE